ncbi:MAG: PKD domain-containing protein [Planctomycetota bacterium]
MSFFFVSGFASRTRVASETITVEVQPKPEIAVPTNPASPGLPVTLSVTSPDGWDRVAWDFGDGAKTPSGSRTETHTFRVRKTCRVKATVYGPDNQSYTCEPLDLGVVGVPVTAGFQELSNGADGNSDSKSGTKPKTYYLYETLPLTDQSEGSIERRQWRVRQPDETEFKTLPPGTTTLPLNRLGEWNIELVVESWPDENGERERAAVSKRLLIRTQPNAAYFWLPVLLTLLGLIYAAWYLLHDNGRRYWRLIRSSNKLPPTKGRGSYGFALHQGGMWNWRTKRAHVPVRRLHHKHYWKDEGKKHFLTIRREKGGKRWSCTIDYSGVVTSGGSHGTVEKLSDDETEYRGILTESRMPEGKQQWYIVIKKQRGFAIWPWAVFLLLLATWSVWVVLVYHWVFE